MNAPRYPLPDVPKIRGILGLLFDHIEVKAGGNVDSSPDSGSHVGVYIADDGAPVALCACDAQLSAYWGSALSMLPIPMAREAARARALNDVMIGNLREIMNICTRLVMCDTSPHLRLDDVYHVRELPSAAARFLASAARDRRDFQIGVPKYGHGQLAFLSS